MPPHRFSIKLENVLNEEIKGLTAAVEALKQEKSGSTQARQEALNALAEGNTKLAEDLFAKIEQDTGKKGKEFGTAFE